MADKGGEARFHLMAVIIELNATGTLLMTAAAQKHTTLDPGVSPGEIKLRVSFLFKSPGKQPFRSAISQIN